MDGQSFNKKKIKKKRDTFGAYQIEYLLMIIKQSSSRSKNCFKSSENKYN